MPSARAITRSSCSAFSNAVSPRMTSRTTVAPSSGTRRRTAPVALVLAAEAAVAVGLLERLDLVGPGGRAVGVAAGEQLLDDLGVAVGAFADWKIGLAVPVDAEPAQRLEDLLDVLGRGALAVGVLDPQDELAARAAGEEPVVQCRPRAADVQRAGRRRSEADAHAGMHAQNRPIRMLIGAHVSPAGGPAKAVERGEERGCRSIQIFNQNPRAWRPRVYSDEEVAAFHEAMEGSDVDALLIHAVYLLNCASEDPEIRDKSLASLTASLRRGRGAEARSASSCTRARR